MQAMFDAVKPTLVGGARVLSASVTIHAPEGSIAAALTEIQNGAPETEIGSYPFARDGRFGTVIVTRGTDRDRVASVSAQVIEMARAIGAEAVDEGIKEP
jgi:molybdopterin-biosynthesis enzyme MoeA-like protein